jgi:hypothetical protein
MNRQARLFRYAALLAILLPWSSLRAVANDEAKLQPSFIVAPGAKEVRSTTFNGRDQLTYRVHSPHPAREVLDLINGELRSQGWTPRREDYLNPGVPTSNVRGWTYFDDLTTNPQSSVWQWNGEWESSRHNIVLYILEYRCPGSLCSSTRDLEDLHVFVLYIRADQR